MVLKTVADNRRIGLIRRNDHSGQMYTELGYLCLDIDEPVHSN